MAMFCCYLGKAVCPQAETIKQSLGRKTRRFAPYVCHLLYDIKGRRALQYVGSVVVVVSVDQTHRGGSNEGKGSNNLGK